MQFPIFPPTWNNLHLTSSLKHCLQLCQKDWTTKKAAVQEKSYQLQNKKLCLCYPEWSACILGELKEGTWSSSVQRFMFTWLQYRWCQSQYSQEQQNQSQERQRGNWLRVHGIKQENIHWLHCALDQALEENLEGMACRFTKLLSYGSSAWI